MGLLKIFFVIALLSFSFGETIRFDIIKDVPLNLNSIAVGLLALIWFFFHLVNRGEKQALLTWPQVSFIGICMLSLLVNFNSLTISELEISFLYLFRFTIFLVLYFVIFDFDKKFIKKIPYMMLFMGGFILIAGYIQYLFYPNLRNLFYLGWDEHLYRMFSVFLDPNFAGAFFSLYLFLTMGLLEVQLKKRRKAEVILLSGLAVFIFIAVFMTYSRSAILMLIVGLLIFLILKKKWMTILFLLAISSILIVASPRAFKTEGTNLFRKVSSEARITSAKEALLIFSRNPLFGVGFNAYKYAKHRYGLAGFKLYSSHAEGGTDISFLFVLATTGLVGFFAYIWLLFNIIKYAYRNYNRNIIAKVLFVSIVALIINSFFINSLFYSFFMFWLWILLGLTENA